MKADPGLKVTQSRMRNAEGTLKKEKKEKRGSGGGGGNKIDPTGAPPFFAPRCEMLLTGNRLINLEDWIPTILSSKPDRI